MGTFIVDFRGAELDTDGASVLVRGAADKVGRVPLGPLERLIVSGEATLSTRLLSELWRRDVGLLLLSGRRREATASLVGRPHDDVLLRINQYREASEEGNWRSRARSIVTAKVAAQSRLLERAKDWSPKARRELMAALRILADLDDRLCDPSITMDRGTLSGIEGAAAAAYFGAYRLLFPASLGFEGRRRRPPPDPVNVCLSLGYSLLHHDVVRELQIVGLDPMVGFLHVPARGRASLASDVMEPFRPHVDEWVWRQFHERTLRGEHFSAGDEGACIMGKAGRSNFYELFDPFAAALRRLCGRVVRALATDLRRSVP